MHIPLSELTSIISTLASLSSFLNQMLIYYKVILLTFLRSRNSLNANQYICYVNEISNINSTVVTSIVSSFTKQEFEFQTMVFPVAFLDLSTSPKHNWTSHGFLAHLLLTFLRNFLGNLKSPGLEQNRCLQHIAGNFLIEKFNCVAS